MSQYWGFAIVTQIILAVVLGALIPLLWSFLLMIISAAMSSAAEADEYRRTLRPGLKKSIAYAVAFFLVVFAIADGAILAMPYVWAGYLRLLAWLGVQVAHTLIAVGVVGLGYGAFKFKEAKKKWYGVVEVVFSAVSVVVALKTTKRIAG